MFYDGSPLFSVVDFNWYWEVERKLAYRPLHVGCHRAWHFCSHENARWDHLPSSSICIMHADDVVYLDPWLVELVTLFLEALDLDGEEQPQAQSYQGWVFMSICAPVADSLFLMFQMFLTLTLIIHLRCVQSSWTLSSQRTGESCD